MRHVSTTWYNGVRVLSGKEYGVRVGVAGKGSGFGFRVTQECTACIGRVVVHRLQGEGDHV